MKRLAFAKGEKDQSVTQSWWNWEDHANNTGEDVDRLRDYLCRGIIVSAVRTAIWSGDCLWHFLAVDLDEQFLLLTLTKYLVLLLTRRCILLSSYIYRYYTVYVYIRCTRTSGCNLSIFTRKIQVTYQQKGKNEKKETEVWGMLVENWFYWGNLLVPNFPTQFSLLKIFWNIVIVQSLCENRKANRIGLFSLVVGRIVHL